MRKLDIVPFDPTMETLEGIMISIIKMGFCMGVLLGLFLIAPLLLILTFITWVRSYVKDRD